jgi:hypothetical protein
VAVWSHEAPLPQIAWRDCGSCHGRRQKAMAAMEDTHRNRVRSRVQGLRCNLLVAFRGVIDKANPIISSLK